MAKYYFLFEVEPKKKILNCINTLYASVFFAFIMIILNGIALYYNIIKFTNEYYFLLMDIYGICSSGFILYGIFKKDEPYVMTGSYIFTIYAVIYFFYFILVLILLFTIKNFYSLQLLIIVIVLFTIILVSHYVFVCFEDCCGEFWNRNTINSNNQNSEILV